LNKAYGKSAAKVIEVYLNDPDATIPEIAKQTGISERTVKSIRAQMKKKGKERFLDLI
jgi:predicted transcriptional regulator